MIREFEMDMNMKNRVVVSWHLSGETVNFEENTFRIET
jgi:hypothetical protein